MSNRNIIALIAGLALVGACSGTSSTPSGKGSGGTSATSNGGAGGSGGKTQTSATNTSSANGGSGSGGAPAGGGSTGSGGSSQDAGSGGVVTGGSGGGQTGTGGSGGGGSTQPPDAAGTGGSGAGGTRPATGGSGTGGTRPANGGTTGSGRGGATASGGATGSGGAAAGGATGTGAAATGGSTSSGGTTGTGPAALVACPDLPGATKSPLYSITVNGSPLFVEKLTKFSPEMQVHYAHGSLSGSGTVTVAVTVSESFNAFKLSPKSRQISATKSGNTLTFDTGPNYLILQPDSKELLFILLDAEETDPPSPDDANVTNVADLGIDNTGATLVTSKIQSAINAASGATKNILYFPPGKYKIGELWLKSNMTMYLACGAILYGSSSTGDFNTGSGGINIEGCSHGVVRMYNISNTKLLGRGVIDGNGKAIRAQNDTKINMLKIEQSKNILVDGILVRDSSFWNTLIYRSDLVTIQNYKMINCRPNRDWNNTDGVDFDESTNGKLYNAFLYTGDDSLATKNEEPSGTVNTKNIVHEKVVCYSNSVGCKIGTKSMGQSMSDVVFRDVDVVKAGRALTIEGYDSAVIQNTKFEDVRVEAADVFIKLALDEPPDWRSAANSSTYKDTYFTNVSSDSNRSIILHGRSGTSGTINGVHFKNLTIQGKAVTSQTDSDASWDIKNGVTNITFE
jgi:hypothetical protein